MSVSSDPRYGTLATIAASSLGSSSQSIIKAILSQWQCEIRDTWPPTRNNPGNLAKGAADSIGIPYTVQRPNPQPGNPIVTYSDPTTGARAYATLINRLPRYRLAVAAAHRGDGAGFLHAITAAGWGTSYSCAIGVYRRLGGTVPTGGDVGGGGGSGGTTAGVDPAKAEAAARQVLGASLDRDTYGQILNELDPFNLDVTKRVLVKSMQLTLGRQDGDVITSADVHKYALQASTGGVQVPSLNPLDTIPVAIGHAADELVAGAIALAVNGAVLVFIAALGYSGLRDVLSADRA